VKLSSIQNSLMWRRLSQLVRKRTSLRQRARDEKIENDALEDARRASRKAWKVARPKGVRESWHVATHGQRRPR